ncbi:MAG: serine--tRNA ligase [Candidatus Nealsonbacteria bacterium]|nr:serine--tRNA ligase [Candidatus Nealsonbacteria bacterium]
MLDIKFIRNYPDKVKQGCKKKQVEVDIDKLLDFDKKKKEYLQRVESLKAKQRKLGKDEIQEAKKIKKEIKKIEPKLEKTKKDFNALMLQIPNLPLDEVPAGKDEKDNLILEEIGVKPKFDFKPKDYLEIATKLDLIDVKRAAKVSGTRFGYLKNDAVLIEFALINFAFDTLSKQGFIPIIPPVMLKADAAKGMGYLEQADKEEAYYLPQDDLYLVGTSEQSIGVLHADEIFKEKELPKRYVGFSTCFRREAGASGKDTKGILRVHQFDKIEMFVFCKPEDSKKEHKHLLDIEKKLMNDLELPYRVVHLCTGDIGRPSASTYDIETWMPGQGIYRETHSTSNCTDFQARRLSIRYRDSKTKKLEFVHTLNGTVFAIPRSLIAIIENYQQKDGSIKIPNILQKYIV